MKTRLLEVTLPNCCFSWTVTSNTEQFLVLHHWERPDEHHCLVGKQQRTGTQGPAKSGSIGWTTNRRCPTVCVCARVCAMACIWIAYLILAEWPTYDLIAVIVLLASVWWWPLQLASKPVLALCLHVFEYYKTLLNSPKEWKPYLSYWTSMNRTCNVIAVFVEAYKAKQTVTFMCFCDLPKTESADDKLSIPCLLFIIVLGQCDCFMHAMWIFWYGYWKEYRHLKQCICHFPNLLCLHSVFLIKRCYSLFFIYRRQCTIINIYV